MTASPEKPRVRRRAPALVVAAASYFAGTVGLQAINFLAQPLFANLMPPGDVAYVAVFLFWATLFGLLISMQVGSSLNNVVSVHGVAHLRDHLNSFVTAFTLAAALLAVVALVIPQPWIDATGLSRPYVLLAVGSGWCTAVVNSGLSQAVALSRPKTYVGLSAGVVAGGVALGIALVLLLPDQRALGRILGYVVASLAVAVVVLVGIRWQPTRRLGTHLGFAVAITSPLLLHEVLSLLINQSNRIFLVHGVGNDQTGVFTFAWSMGSVVALAGTAVNNAWLPWYFRQLDAGNEREVVRQGRRVLWLVGTSTAMLILVSPEVLRLVGHAYASGAGLIPFSVAAGLLTFVFNYASNYVIYRRRTALLLFASIPAAALSLLLNSILIVPYGLMGAAVATVLASLLLVIIVVGLNAFVLRARHLTFGGILAVVCLAGLALLATEVLLSRVDIRWVSAGALGAVGVAILVRYWLRSKRRKVEV